MHIQSLSHTYSFTTYTINKLISQSSRQNYKQSKYDYDTLAEGIVDVLVVTVLVPVLAAVVFIPVSPLALMAWFADVLVVSADAVTGV